MSKHNPIDTPNNKAQHNSSAKHAYLHLMDVLSDVTTPDDIITGSNDGISEDVIFGACLSRAKRLFGFETKAILTPNDELEFGIE